MPINLIIGFRILLASLISKESDKEFLKKLFTFDFNSNSFLQTYRGFFHNFEWTLNGMNKRILYISQVFNHIRNSHSNFSPIPYIISLLQHKAALKSIRKSISLFFFPLLNAIYNYFVFFFCIWNEICAKCFICLQHNEVN